MQLSLLSFSECFKTNVITNAIPITYSVIVIDCIVILFIRNPNRLHLCCNRPMSDAKRVKVMSMNSSIF